jgi:hypothetical protein
MSGSGTISSWVIGIAAFTLFWAIGAVLLVVVLLMPLN